MGNVSPSFFHETAKSLHQSYMSALESVVRTYPPYATNNVLPQNKRDYDSALQHLAGVESSYGVYKWFLVQCMQYANYNIKQMDNSTTLIAAANANLEKELYTSSGETHAADGALNDSHLLYNQQLLANIILCLFLAGACLLYYYNDTLQFNDLRKSISGLTALIVLTLLIKVAFWRKLWVHNNKTFF